MRPTSHGFELVLTVNNFQEWASCWKSGSPEKEQRGRQLLQYALAIRPRRRLAPAHQLMMREIRTLFGQPLRGPFLPPEDNVTAERFFRRFADGEATEVDRETMLSHWAVKADATARANQLREQRQGRYDTSQRLDDFLRRYPTICPDTLRVYVRKALLGASVTGKELKRIARHLDKCPALRASVRADAFINWRIATRRAMQHDRWDDLRHCVDASYADVFVTCDAALRAACDEIKPGARVMTLRDLAGMVQISYNGP